jgi:hypothetical protein
MAEQIKIARRPEWIDHPGDEEHRAFQNEAVAMSGNA